MHSGIAICDRRKTATIKVFGVAKVLDNFRPLRLADCLPDPQNRTRDIRINALEIELPRRYVNCSRPPFESAGQSICLTQMRH
jgi:hypothetical protein